MIIFRCDDCEHEQETNKLRTPNGWGVFHVRDESGKFSGDVVRCCPPCHASRLKKLRSMNEAAALAWAGQE